MTSAAADLSAVAAGVERYPAQAVRHATDSLRRVVTPELRRDTGGDARLSGLGGGGKMRVEVEITGAVTGGAVIGTVSAGPRKLRGPWRWIDAGTRPRVQGAAGRHPGTPAKGTWTDTVAQALPAIETDLASMFERTVR